MIALNINGKTRNVEVDPATPLLWVLRENLDMTGTKFGCGMALCGACTVHLDGQPIRSCSTPVSAAAGKRVTTIEAIGATATGRKVQAAWKSIDVRSAATASRARSCRPWRCSKPSRSRPTPTSTPR